MIAGWSSCAVGATVAWPSALPSTTFSSRCITCVSTTSLSTASSTSTRSVTLGGCPSAPFGSGKRAVVETARDLAIESASGTPWPNPTLHEYLEALAGWIEDSDGHYPRHPPQNGWEVVNDALRAATVYE